MSNLPGITFAEMVIKIWPDATPDAAEKMEARLEKCLLDGRERAAETGDE